MTLTVTLDEMIKKLPPPTDEELTDAETELCALEGNILYGHKVYVAKDPNVRGLQVKAWAYGYVHNRLKREAKESYEARFGVYEQPEKPDPVDPNETKWNFERDRSTRLVGDRSIYAGISINGPETKRTAVVEFLLGTFAPSKKANCLLLGGPGCGKTYAAIGYVAQFQRAEFITAFRLSELQIRKDYERLDRIDAIENLVIDDLGTEPEGYKGSDFRAYFEDLFISRHANQRKTIITCNGTLENFKAAYGERILSRLRETGLVFSSGEDDMRGGQDA